MIVTAFYFAIAINWKRPPRPVYAGTMQLVDLPKHNQMQIVTSELKKAGIQTYYFVNFFQAGVFVSGHVAKARSIVESVAEREGFSFIDTDPRIPLKSAAKSEIGAVLGSWSTPRNEGSAIVTDFASMAIRLLLKEDQSCELSIGRSGPFKGQWTVDEGSVRVMLTDEGVWPRWDFQLGKDFQGQYLFSRSESTFLRKD